MVLKVLRSVLLVLLFSSTAAMAQEAPKFVSVIDDLPLMNGLVEAGEGVEFATPQGRIVEATAYAVGSAAVSHVALTRQAVVDFYAQTLPQLGWTSSSEARFVREGETLDLVFSEDGGILSVRFSLAPTDK